MNTIEAETFQEQCMALLDGLAAHGLIITKDGKPIARVVPYDSGSADLIGSLRHKVKIQGDILTTGLRWNLDTWTSPP